MMGQKAPMSQEAFDAAMAERLFCLLTKHIPDWGTLPTLVRASRVKARQQKAFAFVLCLMLLENPRLDEALSEIVPVLNGVPPETEGGKAYLRARRILLRLVSKGVIEAGQSGAKANA